MPRTFAVCAATALLLVVFFPAVGPANTEAVAPPTTDEPAKPSDSASLPTGPTDSPGGPSPPPGSATSAFVAPPPLLSSLPGELVPPHVEDTGLAYRYSTVVGYYEFSKATPYLATYTTTDGEVLVAASTFMVRWPGVVPFVEPTVLQAGDFRYETRYSLLDGIEPVGIVTVTFNFRIDGPPKITVSLDRMGNESFALTWVTLTLDTIAFNGSEAKDFASTDPPSPIATPDFRLSVGPDADPENWQRRLVLDWSDAQAGSALVGRFTVAGLTGPAVLVVFPANMSTVDPSLVGSSTQQYATDYPIQRKTFAYGGRFWAFWYDGSAIAYASSEFSYANGINTLTWTAKMTSPSGALPIGANYRGFDVDQRGGTVLVGYIPDGLTSMKVLVGVITGTFITWYGPVVVYSWQPPGYPVDPLVGSGIPSVAIGTDGYFWASFVWGYYYIPSGFYAYKVEYYRSEFPGSGAFLWKANNDVTPPVEDTAVRLIALSNGTLVSLTSTKGQTTVTSRRSGVGGWGTLRTWDVKVGTGENRGEILSAVADSKDRVHILFNGHDVYAPGIRYTVLQTDDTLSPDPPIATDTSASTEQPALALDSNGELHAFWRKWDSASSYRVRYSRQLPENKSWASFTEMWSSSGVPHRGMTAGPAATSHATLLWTQGTANPYSINLGLVPTPADSGSQAGQPWERQGLSPYQSYFRQLSEFVSPGSGLLTVRQTDLSIPGRGLDLELARIFTTPRAFQSGGASPYLYEAYSAANLGVGWGLDLAWISPQYLHLWGGQMYVLNWRGDTFENHDGAHFLLKRVCTPSCTYTLYAKDGHRYEFNNAGQLKKIYDLFGNTINIYYDANGRIDYIIDTVGRNIDFVVNGNGTLASISSGGQTTSYFYQTIGTSTVLSSFRDPLGRQTRFEYTDLRSPYLLTAIQYPMGASTGAKTTFSWTNPSVQVGPDIYAYLVTRQDTLNRWGQSIRANVYDYTVVNGKISYVKVTTHDAGVAKGSTVQLLDPVSGKSTTIRRDAGENQLESQVTWFGGGAVSQVDTFPGASAVPSYSTYASYDDWGNPVYSMDAVGHEKFASFVNTRYQGGFYAPGRVTQSWSGRLFFDDFDDRNITDWNLYQSGGSVGLDYTKFEVAPPALKVYHNGAASASAQAVHTFSAMSFLVAEATVRAEETNRYHYVALDAGATVRAQVVMLSNGYIAYWSGSAWTNLMTYQAKQWYRIGFEANSGGSTYDIWINGAEVATGVPMIGSGTIDRIRFEASCYNCNAAATVFVDAVRVYQSLDLTITGLSEYKVVQFASSVGPSAVGRVAVGATSITLTAKPSSYPTGSLRVYGLDSRIEFESPSREFWGGGSWAYTPPWKAFPARPVTGFLRANSVWVDEGLPTNAVTGGSESFAGGNLDYPVNRSWSHRSTYSTGTHDHNFRDATDTRTLVSGSYLIQFIRVPANYYPGTIMLEFRDLSNSWEHRAYWGADLIARGINDTVSKRWMGPLTAQEGRWLMLLVRADDVGMIGASATLEGIGYVLFGGNATWDFSAIGGPDFGEIGVSGLQSGWTVDFYDAKGVRRACKTVPVGKTIAFLQLYNNTSDPCDAGIRTFPFDGYFIVKDGGGSALYRSPIMSFWGGDTYNYGGTDFYPNANVDPTIHDRLACTLEYQTGRSGSPQVPMTGCSRYNSKGLMDFSKVYDGVAWRETNYTYDSTYGFLTSVRDPKGNTVSYSYSPTYGRAYVTKQSDGIGNVSRYTYDPRTGWPLAELDGRGYLTRYAYDALGRGTMESRFDRSPSSEVLYLDMEWTTEDPVPKLEDRSGNSNHGTITGLTQAPGKIGFARDFSGSSQYARVTRKSVLEPTRLTVSAWIYPHTTQAVMDIVDKSFPDTTGSGYVLLANADGSIQFSVYDGDTTPPSAISPAGALKANEWQHVLGIYDGTNVRVFLNGIERATTAFSGSISYNDVNRDMWIGSKYDGNGRFFDGIIDEVRVSSVALSSIDLNALYSNSYRLLSSSAAAFDDAGNSLTTYEPTTMPRLLHYDMESLLNDKLEDLAGRGNHATFNDVSIVDPGKHGKAYRISGTSSYVRLVDTAAVEGLASFSVGMWVNVTADSYSLIRKEGAWLIELGGSNWGAVGRYVQFGIWQGGVFKKVAHSTTAVPLNQWTHVLATWDGLRGRIYFDGALNADANVDGASGATDASANDLYIGSWPIGSEPVSAAVDEFQMFDRTLTSSEIQGIFQASEKGFYQKTYFDSLGRATRTMRRDLFSTITSWESYGYNFQDRVVTQTVARSSALTYYTTYTFDFLGRPTSVLYPDYPIIPVNFTYDDVNRIRTVVEENGRKVQYVSDLGGRTTSVREYYSPTNYYTTFYSYDDVGNLVTVMNALNQITRHEYDRLSRLTKTTYPDAIKIEKYAYDEVGNLKNRTDRAGLITRYEYDARNRLDLICYGDSVCDLAAADVNFDYDANDNPTSIGTSSPAPVTAVSYAYDGLNRVTYENTTVSGSAYSVGYSYDRASRLTRLTYPDGYAVDYAFDAVGRTLNVKDGSTTFATFAYHADDLVKDIVLGNQVTKSYLYNGLPQPTSIKATYQTTTYLDLPYTFDLSKDNVATIGSSSFTYDKLDRLETASGTFGATYRYDAIGNRLAEEKSTATFSTLRPDANIGTPGWSYVGSCTANWACVDDTASDGDSSYVKATSVGLTDLYRLPDIPAIGSKGIEYVEVTVVARDTDPPSPPPGRCPPICPESPGPSGVDPGSGATIQSGTDNGIYLRVNGNRSSYRSLGYEYATYTQRWTTNPVTAKPWTEAEVNALQAGVEAADVIPGKELRVTQLSVSVKVFDGSVYYYSPTLNELTSVNRNGALTSFIYDANGNLLSKFNTTKTCYEWNSENLLTRVKSIPSSCADQGTQVQKYIYDGLGRRIKVEGTDQNTWTVSIVSGMNVIYQKTNTGAITKYVYAHGMRIAAITPSGAAHYYLGDHLGSTRIVLDANRNPVFSTEYEPFGRPLNPSGSQSFKFTGEVHDPTELVYLRARLYDPEIGRFVSADPALGTLPVPQTLNRYVYAINNPLRYTDPTGKFIPLIIIIIVVVLVAAGAATAVAADAIPELRPYTDIVATAVGFIPVYGDAFSAGYFLTQDAVDCLQGDACDPLDIGLDIAGSIPLVGDTARYARSGARYVDLFPTVGRLFGHAGDAARAAGRVDDVASGIAQFFRVMDVGGYAGRSHVHHLLPRQFGAFFERAGLHIDDFTVALDAQVHRLIHGKGGPLVDGWNAHWGRFFAKDPGATASDILRYLDELKVKFYLS